MEYVDGGGKVSLTISRPTIARIARIVTLGLGTVAGVLIGLKIGTIPGAIIGGAFGAVVGFIAGNYIANKIHRPQTISANINGYSGHYYI